MSSARSYWLNLFSSETWEEFRAAGSAVTGFRDSRWNAVQKVQRGDYMLCYLTGLSRWAGLLEVTSGAFRDESTIWQGDVFPARVKIRPIIQLEPSTAVPIFDLRDKLSIFRNLTNPNAWTGHLRGSPVKWQADDARIVIDALEKAQANPVDRPVDPAKKRRISPYLKSKRPEKFTDFTRLDESPSSSRENSESDPVDRRSGTPHTRIQWLLLNLGVDMGLDVWIAKSDVGRDWEGRPFSTLKNLRKRLPRQFDEYTSRTIE